MFAKSFFIMGKQVLIIFKDLQIFILQKLGLHTLFSIFIYVAKMKLFFLQHIIKNDMFKHEKVIKNGEKVGPWYIYCFWNKMILYLYLIFSNPMDLYYRVNSIGALWVKHGTSVRYVCICICILQMQKIGKKLKISFQNTTANNSQEKILQ